MVADSPQLCL